MKYADLSHEEFIKIAPDLSLKALIGQHKKCERYLKWFDDALIKAPPIKKIDPAKSEICSNYETLAKYYVERKTKVFLYDGAFKLVRVGLFIENGNCLGYRLVLQEAYGQKVYLCFNENHRLDSQLADGIYRTTKKKSFLPQYHKSKSASLSAWYCDGEIIEIRAPFAVNLPREWFRKNSIIPLQSIKKASSPEALVMYLLSNDSLIRNQAEKRGLELVF